MKRLLILMLAVVPFCSKAQSTAAGVQLEPTKKKEEKPDAKKPEAYKMKQYYFVMLTKGARRDEIKDTNQLKKIQEGHLANIARLAEMGKIVMAGPFGDEGNWRGIFIFNCPTKAEVEKLLATDPAIAAGRLSYEIHPWWTAQNCLFK